MHGAIGTLCRRISHCRLLPYIGLYVAAMAEINLHPEALALERLTKANNLKPYYELSVEDARQRNRNAAEIFGGTHDFSGTRHEIFVPSSEVDGETTPESTPQGPRLIFIRPGPGLYPGCGSNKVSLVLLLLQWYTCAVQGPWKGVGLMPIVYLSKMPMSIVHFSEKKSRSHCSCRILTSNLSEIGLQIQCRLSTFLSRLLKITHSPALVQTCIAI